MAETGLTPTPTPTTETRRCWSDYPRFFGSPSGPCERTASAALATVLILGGIAVMHRVLHHQRRLPTRFAQFLKVAAPTTLVLTTQQVAGAVYGRRSDPIPANEDDNSDVAAAAGGTSKIIDLELEREAQEAARKDVVDAVNAALDTAVGDGEGKIPAAVAEGIRTDIAARLAGLDKSVAFNRTWYLPWTWFRQAAS